MDVRGVLATLILSAAGLAPAAAAERPPGLIRIATFNSSLNRATPDALRRDLATPDNGQAKAVAEIIQRVRPDILLLQEFDYDDEGVALRRFQANYLGKPQNGAEAIKFEDSFFTESNTGQPSGLDLNNDGRVEGAEDALGFGEFPGQYAMALLSRFPIDRAQTRTFRKFLWRDMPDAMLPDNPATPAPADWYSPQELAVLRLSSKSHWDVPVQIGKVTLHLLASHPTPPAFDGAEDRNGKRNHDEIRLWSDYLDNAAWLRDDAGRSGKFKAKEFLIMGDQNSDPVDGGSINSAIGALLAHPRIDASFVPKSSGAAEASAAQGGANATQRGDPGTDTADFNDRVAGNLRVDYLLPSKELRVCGGGVFWPSKADPAAALVWGDSPAPSSDHRLVWLDVTVDGAQCPPGSDLKASVTLHPRR